MASADPREYGFSACEPHTAVRATALIDGRYRIIGELGAGATGTVFRAEDVMLKRVVALKMAALGEDRSADAMDALLREAQVLARLRHDNVVAVHSFGTTERAAFMAMEYVDGETLDRVIARHTAAGTKMPVARVLDIVVAMAAGLSAAQARGIAHLDVKPSNVVLERETGRPVVVDFGNAHDLLDPEHPASGAGTPSYMAPEQIRNEATIDARADVYSLACTAFEMLTGRAVFEGTQAYEVLLAHAANAPPLVSSVRAELAPLDRVFDRALAKKPSSRPLSCSAFATELRRAAYAGGVVEPVTLVPPASDVVRVLVLARDDGFKHGVFEEAEGALRDATCDASIECVVARGDVLAAFERNPASLVVLDDDVADGAAIDIAACIRRMPRGAATQIVVVTRDTETEPELWSSIGARRLAKPFGTGALASECARLLSA